MFKTKELKAEIDHLKADLDYHRAIAERAQKEQIEARQEAIKLGDELVKLKNEVRGQIQADMLVIALKAMGAIPDPDKLDYEKEMIRYRNQLSSLRNMGMSGYQQGLGQSLGGGLFGGIL